MEESLERLERLDELINRMIDDEPTDDEFRELEKCLANDESSRRHYVEIMTLHADLIDHYRGGEGESGLRVPVLGSLGVDLPTGTALPQKAD